MYRYSWLVMHSRSRENLIFKKRREIVPYLYGHFLFLKDLSDEGLHMLLRLPNILLERIRVTVGRPRSAQEVDRQFSPQARVDIAKQQEHHTHSAYYINLISFVVKLLRLKHFFSSLSLLILPARIESKKIFLRKKTFQKKSW